MVNEPIDSHTSLIYLLVDSLLHKISISKYISCHIRDRWRVRYQYIDHITNFENMENLLLPISKSLNIDINFMLSVFFYSNEDNKSIHELINDNCEASWSIIRSSLNKVKDYSSLTLLIRFMFELSLKDDDHIIYPLRKLAINLLHYAISNKQNHNLFEWSLKIILQYFDILCSNYGIIENLCLFIEEYPPNYSIALLVIKIIHRFISQHILKQGNETLLLKISSLLKIISKGSHTMEDAISLNNYSHDKLDLDSIVLIQYFKLKYLKANYLLENMTNSKYKIFEFISHTNYFHSYCFINTSIEDINIYTMRKSYWFEDDCYSIEDIFEDIFEDCLNEEQLESQIKQDKNQEIYHSLHYCEKALLYMQIQVYMIILYKCRNIDFMRFTYSLYTFIMNVLYEKKSKRKIINLKDLILV